MAKNTKKSLQDQELTAEQKALLPEYRDRFEKLALSTTPTNRELAEKHLRAVYNFLNVEGVAEYHKDPEIIWAESPLLGAKVAAQHAKGDLNVTREEIHAQASNASYGSLDAYWVAVYSFINEQLLPTDQKDKLAELTLSLVEECGVFWTFEDLIIVTPKPSALHMKDGKFHCATGHAIGWPNGDGIFVFNGEIKKSLMDIVMANRNGGNNDAA